MASKLTSASGNGRCLSCRRLRLLSRLLLLCWKTCGWIFLLVVALVLVSLIVEIACVISEVATTITTIIAIVTVVSVSNITVIVKIAATILASRSTTVVIEISANWITQKNELKSWNNFISLNWNWVKMNHFDENDWWLMLTLRDEPKTHQMFRYSAYVQGANQCDFYPFGR